MNLRQLARFLASPDLIDKLANTPFMRRLAQLTHYSYLKASEAGQKSIENMVKKGESDSKGNQTFMFSRFLKRFYENLQKEIEKNSRK